MTFLKICIKSSIRSQFRQTDFSLSKKVVSIVASEMYFNVGKIKLLLLTLKFIVFKLTDVKCS